MDGERGVVYAVVGVILLTTLASGPLVGAVDLTPAHERPSFGEGNATVGDVTLPERAEITAGRFDAGEYYLRVPDASVELRSVAGRPLVAYRLSIPELGYARSTTHFVSAANVGTLSLTLERDAIESSAIEASSYDGQLAVLLRAGDRERTLGSRNVTVEVVE